MYKISKKFDCSLILGKELEMLCFSKYQITFHFDGDFSVSSTYEIKYKFKNKEEHILPLPVTSTDLVQLIEDKICHAEIINSGAELLIEFSSGARIVLLNCPRYESFVIYINQEEIYV